MWDDSKRSNEVVLRTLLSATTVLFSQLTGLGLTIHSQPAQANALYGGATTQANVRELEPGKAVEREMRGGEEHKYQISLEAGQYLDAVVEQRGIDVVVQVVGPDGRQLFEVDSPNGANGPEPVELVSEAAGVYRLVVKSLEEKAPAGRYEIRVNQIRAATDEDRRAVEKNRALLEASVLEAQAEDLRVRGKYDEALALNNRVLEARERLLGRDAPEVASSLNGIAMVYHDTGDYAKAESFYLQSLAIREKTLGPNDPLVANSLNNLAILYRMNADYSKAEQFLIRAVAIRKTAFGPQNLYVANSLNNLADLYLDTGDYAKAELQYREALAIREKALNPEHQYVAESLIGLARLLELKSEYEEAGRLFERALKIREKYFGNQHPMVANSMIWLARIYQDEGDYAKAEPLLTSALAVMEKAHGTNHRDVANALDNLAGLYRTKGDLEKAEPLYVRALTIRENIFGAMHPEVATSVNDLGLLYQDMGAYDKAVALHTRSVAISEKLYGPNHPETATSLGNLALAYTGQGEYDKAESLYERAIAVQEKAFGANSEKLSIVLNNLALLYARRGNYQKSIELNKRALALNEKAFGTGHPLITTSLSNLALAYLASGDISNAVEYGRRGDDSAESDLARNLVSGSQRQKLAYLNQYASDIDFSVSLNANSAPNNAEARRLALTTILRRKGRAVDAMTDSMSTLRRRASPEDRKLLDELAEVRSQLAALTLRGPGSEGAEKHQASLKALEQKSENLENQISQRSFEFRARLTSIDFENVRRAIPQGSVLVEFTSYRPINARAAKKEERFGTPRYAAYVLRREGDISWVDLGDAKEIDDKVDVFRKELRNKRSKDVKHLAREVDIAVMQPVRKLVGTTRRVFLSPDGALNLIPFAALVDEHNQYLVKRYSFTYLSSGRDLLRLQTKVQGKTAKLVIADPDFGEKTPGASGTRNANEADELYFSPLEATEEEARELNQLFPDANVLTRGQATEAALKSVERPAILHIATHGFFLDELAHVQPGNDKEPTRIVNYRRGGTKDNDPSQLVNPLLRSGLGLAGANTGISKDGNDGILTALEAAGLDLWGTKLVVLSACDTGVGKVVSGDGVYGLRRALVLAGSESQMISLWPVSDTGTSELMVGYYKALKAGAGRSDALRQVQLHMLRDPKRRHPFYWASFIESGDWTSLDGTP
jgi:CHAT domain-containing protein/Tfp pilus assembly protein PilF